MAATQPDLAICAACIIIIGVVAAAAGQGTTSSYTQAGFVLAWLLTYYLTVGPVCYAIITLSIIRPYHRLRGSRKMYFRTLTLLWRVPITLGLNFYLSIF